MEFGCIQQFLNVENNSKKKLFINNGEIKIFFVDELEKFFKLFLKKINS